MQKIHTFVSLMLCCLAGASLLAAANGTPEKEAAVTVINFAKGAWDDTKWTPARLANQAQAIPFVQLDGAIGITAETFTKADWAAEVDNAIMLYDLGTTEAEIVVTFTMGQGLGSAESHSCPGLCISPQVKDGMVESSIAVFAADYTFAVWYQTTGADGKTVRYQHLLQLGRWFDPAKPHTLRCRISKQAASVALQLDDADVIVLSFIGNKTYGSVEQPLNSLIGLWGCHGACAFREMTVSSPGTLPFTGRAPEKDPR